MPFMKPKPAPHKVEVKPPEDPARAKELALRHAPKAPDAIPVPKILPGDTTPGRGGITPSR